LSTMSGSSSTMRMRGSAMARAFYRATSTDAGLARDARSI
jgi:hypothetical protein